MRIYQFLFFDPAGRSPALDFAECPDDGAAARSAIHQLSLHDTCEGVEVFEGDRLVVRLAERAGEFISRGGPQNATW
jgi:hypothetical protein